MAYHGNVVDIFGGLRTRAIVPIRERITVLAADAAGYSRLMELDEEDTHQRLMRLRMQVYQPLLARFNGRLVKHTGDGFLATFGNSASGMDCAVEIQRHVMRLEADQPPERRVLLRMGLNVCEAIFELDDVFGEGVNIAARLQAYAEPGDLVLTRALADEIDLERSGAPWVDLGELTLKNLSRPVSAITVRVGSAGRPSPVAPRSDEIRPSIAILPFRYPRMRKDEEMLATGIVDQLVNTLGALRQLFVISRASTRAFGDRTVDARRVGRALGVRYVLHGAVHRNRQRVAIHTELAETGTGEVVISERLEGSYEDLFALESRVAVQVLRSIAPQVQERELSRIRRQPPDSRTAYDLTLQALDHLFRMDRASHGRARGLLQQAISDGPEFAPARTYMAYALFLRVGEGWSSDPQADSMLAARMANEALERDRVDPLALAIFGHINALLFKNYDAARMFLDRAIEVGPNSANAWTLSSATHGYLGHGEEAIAHADYGRRLSPLDAHVFWHESLLGQAYYVAARFEEALHWARRAMTQNGNMVANLRLLAATLVAMGQHEEARGVAGRLLAAQPEFRLSTYAPRCPFTPAILRPWLDRLHEAGLPP